MNIVNLTEKIIFFVYKKMLGREPGPIAINSIKNLGYASLGLMLAKSSSLFFQVYAGRIIGITEYGKFALIFSISQFLYIPMLMGIPLAMVKYLAEQKNEDDKRAIISTAVTLIFSFMLLFSVIFYIFSSQIASVISVSHSYVSIAILISIFFSGWGVSQKIAQGLHDIKKVSFIEVMRGIISAVSLIFLLSSYPNARAPIFALLSAYMASSIIIIPTLLKYFNFKVDTRWAKILLKYGIIGFSAGIPWIITENINKVLLNVFLGLKDVGLYHAYHLSSFGVGYLLMTSLSTAYFPEFSRYNNKEILFDQVIKFSRTAPFIYVTISTASIFVFLLYGSGFHLSLPLIFLFAFAATITFLYSLYTLFAAACGIRGIKIVTISTTVISILTLSISYSLIPLIGLYGAVISMILSYFVGLLVVYAWTKKLIRNYS